MSCITAKEGGKNLRRHRSHLLQHPPSPHPKTGAHGLQVLWAYGNPFEVEGWFARRSWRMWAPPGQRQMHDLLAEEILRIPFRFENAHDQFMKLAYRMVTHSSCHLGTFCSNLAASWGAEGHPFVIQVLSLQIPFQYPLLCLYQSLLQACPLQI